MRKRRGDSLTLSLAGGEVEIRVGVRVLANWLEVDQVDVRTMLLSVFGAAASGHHAVPPARPGVAAPAAPSAPDDDGADALIAAFRARAKRG